MNELNYTAFYAVVFGLDILNKRVYLDADEVLNIFLGDDIGATIQSTRDSQKS